MNKKLVESLVILESSFLQNRTTQRTPPEARRSAKKNLYCCPLVRSIIGFQWSGRDLATIKATLLHSCLNSSLPAQQHWSEFALLSAVARAECFFFFFEKWRMCHSLSEKVQARPQALRSYSSKRDNVAHSLEKVKVISFFPSSRFRFWPLNLDEGQDYYLISHSLTFFSPSRGRDSDLEISQQLRRPRKENSRNIEMPFFVYLCSRNFKES